jgi:LDH2 family malate/lactate/ureidoglycolate dehydrogenase
MLACTVTRGSALSVVVQVLLAWLSGMSSSMTCCRTLLVEASPRCVGELSSASVMPVGKPLVTELQHTRLYNSTTSKLKSVVACICSGQQWAQV